MASKSKYHRLKTSVNGRRLPFEYHCRPRGDKRRFYLLFVLTMPKRNTWNGKWTGDGVFYGHIEVLHRTKKSATRIKQLRGQNYQYDFGDGWVANIAVSQVSSAIARSVEATSHGFCGYYWMADSILKHGRIQSSTTP